MGATPLPSWTPLEKKLEVGTDGQMQKVYAFRDPVLQASIKSALDKATSNSVVLDLEKNESGVNVAIAARINGHWSIAGAWKKDGYGQGLASTIKFEW